VKLWFWKSIFISVPLTPQAVRRGTLRGEVATGRGRSHLGHKYRG
jgi:hypothetical protein